MKRIGLIAGFALFVLLGAAGGWYFMRGGVVSAAPPAAPAAANTESSARAQGLDGTIIADAKVVPVQAADLSLPAAGVVAELLVQEGAQVKEGDLLLRLDAAQQQVGVAQAQAQLARAQAALAQLTAGPRAQEILTAQAAVDAATARLVRLTDGAAPGQIAQAEAALAASSAAYAKLYEGADDSAIIAARADLANAEAALTQAQRAYDQVSSRNDIGALPQSAQLQTATNNYEAARARLELLSKGPSSADVAAAGAEVERQRAGLETLQNTLPEDTAAAQADLASSQAQLDLLLAGARPEQIAIAEADVAAATAQVQQALVALANTELRAPFAGTVAALDVAVGEQVGAGAVVAALADLTRWQIETSDLTETDIVNVPPGTQVALAFDALPGLTLAGQVRLIRPRGGDNRGDVVYTAVIDPTTTDPRLLWNMTAVVTVNAQ